MHLNYTDAELQDLVAFQINSKLAIQLFDPMQISGTNPPYLVKQNKHLKQSWPIKSLKTLSGFHHAPIMHRKYILSIAYNTALLFLRRKKNILPWPRDELSKQEKQKNQYQIQWHIN